MTSSLRVIFLFALITLALAAPHNVPQKRSFKVERIPNPNFKRTPGAGTRALIKAYAKFGMPLPGLLDAMNAAAAANAAANAGALEGVAGSKDKAAGALGNLGGLGGGLSDLLGELTGGGNTQKGAKPAAAKAPAAKTVTAGSPKATAKPSGLSTPPFASNGTAAAAAAKGSGKVTATPEKGDIEYLSPVTIGGQTMNMDFDSGSSDLWVFNTQLPAAQQVGHTVFDPKKSATFKVLAGNNFSISYGDGSGAAGNVGTDEVNIGGAVVPAQAVELAQAVSGSFVQDTQSNGLVGLAFSKLNTVKPQKQKTFFDNVMPSLAEPVFTADLRHNAVGAYEFGAIDSTKFSGALSWAPINTTNGFWQFASQKFAVGTGSPINVAGGQAIADTGTTLMLVNPAVVNAYYSQVTGAVNNQTVGGVTFPCNSVLPDLAVDVGGQFMATVKGSDINFAPVDAAGKTCFGGVQATASGLQIYGDIMFKSQFVVFNGGNNSIAMAPHQ